MKEEAPQKKTRGRPKKAEISESAPHASKSRSRTTKKEETSKAAVAAKEEPKGRRGRAKKQDKKEMEIEESKSQGKRESQTSARKSRSKTANKDEMEIETSVTPAPARRGRKAATNKRESELATPVTSRSKSKTKKQEEQPASQRVGRSNRKISTEPAVTNSARKGRRSTSSKQSVDASPKHDSLPPRPSSTEVQKPSVPQFKAPAIKPRGPQTEKPQERNLLRSINAEPNMSTPIQVTVRKSAGKKAISSAIAAKIGEKRSSSFWLKDLAAPNCNIFF